jgi:hypothetical protein
VSSVDPTRALENDHLHGGLRLSGVAAPMQGATFLVYVESVLVPDLPAGGTTGATVSNRMSTPA